MQRIKNFFNFRELFLKMLDENYRIKSFNTFKMFLFKKIRLSVWIYFVFIRSFIYLAKQNRTSQHHSTKPSKMFLK